ncbi:molecular chaperone [Pseudomonas antarctica]|uniref:Chaperone protein EcpD n=1 Tax=Pseudomonas antarctica TaxID=219572 RepID=A0A1G9UZ76_9PSED|nr:fimbria/pilus periplasmic chaperone [Pseudomonas antarctica]KAF2408575.1 chaperone protein EcpD precursor [Pseudomonas antarctica]SDM65301.1 chaperone protein EcpD [Pseudomonas antarctica]
MNKMTRLVLATCACGLLSLLAPPAHAGVIIHGTRVIYPAQQQEVAVRLENKGPRPALVQAWLDNGDRHSTPATAQTPFNVSPPILRIEPHQQQALRLRYFGEALPTDRESLFWLNVLEVPPLATDTAQKNQIELSFRTRLRVFLRPQALPYPVGSAPAKLQWKLVAHEQGLALQATNPTPYHISLASIDLLSDGKRFSKAANKGANDSLLMPGGDVKLFVLPLLRNRPSSASTVEFTTVSDFGARVRHSAGLSPSSAG